jgi:hypothetical protein
MTTDSGRAKKKPKDPEKAKYSTSRAIAILRREKYRSDPGSFNEKAASAAKPLFAAVAEAIEAAEYRTVRRNGEDTIIEIIEKAGSRMAKKARLLIEERVVHLQVSSSRALDQWDKPTSPEIEYRPETDRFVARADEAGVDEARAAIGAGGDSAPESPKKRRNPVVVVVEAIIAAMAPGIG